LFCCERLEALAGCVKGRVDGGLEAAHCLGFSVLDAIVARGDAALFVEGDPRTPGECARTAASAGEAGVYGDVGHAFSQFSSQHFTVSKAVLFDTLAV